ncbi:MAG: PAS domain-containing protein [Candidatus Omnitrophica bacterium]|nr:PAS domain-containing protein [Candidatus Omnitrophota bacterium]
MNPLIISIISGTVIISVAIAIGLVKIAKLNASVDLRRTSVLRRKEKGESSEIGKVETEISEIINSVKNKEELIKKMRETFDREFQRNSESIEREFSHKFEQVLDEKKNTEHILTKKYKKVLQDKKQTEAIMHSVAEGMVVVDKKGKVLLMNPAAEKILDTEREEKINKSIFSDLKSGQLVSMTKEKRKGAAPKTIEFKSDSDETEKIIRSSSAVIQNENGQTVGMVSILTDITKQRDLDRMKTNFINTVTHEFRTPIVAMQKSILVMISGATGKINAPQKKFLDIAKRNLERLNLLIDDLLNLSKLEERKLSLSLSAYSVEAVIDDISETVSTWAESKAITINKHIQAHLPKPYIDPNRIAQVLNNLLSNAIKFTPPNGIINIEANPIDGGKMVRVVVEDSGVGMEKEDQEKVFDKFYQIGERTTTNITGTGLGLPISKEIVEMHNGKIWVESEKNKGSKFIFTLPVI